MRRTPPTSTVPQRTAHRLALFVAGLLTLSTAAAGCGPASPPPSTAATATAAQSMPSLLYTLDGTFVTSTSSNNLRPSVVALDAHDGHRAWLHTLEAANPADGISAASPPLYRDDLVYVSYYYDHVDHSGDPKTRVRRGVVAALDATTGQERWRREVGSMLAWEPVVDGSTVYVSASVVPALTTQGQPLPGQPLPAVTGLVEALDTRTGDVRWSRALPTAPDPSMATSADGRVFVIANRQSAGDVLALDASDGSVRWDYASDALLTRGGGLLYAGPNAPQVVAGQVYVETTERDAREGAQLKLLALDAGSGRVAWQHQTQGIAATPAFNQSGDTVCLSVADPVANVSDIFGLAAASGTPGWSITGMAGLVSGCTASGDTFYLTQRSADGTTGSVLALTSQGASARSIWKTATAAPVTSDRPLAPAEGGGIVGVYLAASPPGRAAMAALRASDGQLLWQRAFNGSPYVALNIEGSLIVNSEFSGNLPIVAAYALDTGAPLWTYALGHL
jgi:outer membrane protein assembly factor BamB